MSFKMATLVVVLLCSKIIFQSFPVVSASTHWIVTEDGRIQSQIGSIFTLRRPYDLVALLRQEERAVMLRQLRQELLTRKEEIDKNEDKDTGLEQRFYKTDADCVAAGKPLPELDLYISTVLPLENKGIRPREHIDFKVSPTATPRSPYCTDVIDLDYSIHAFEHLEGMKDRENLTGTPELGLKNAITHRENVDDYGHLIYEALKKNDSSWVLYNMAAFYWRIKGVPYHVVECLRRALHFSPRLQKDVALISLANVLHRSRYSNEAAIVVHAALDVSKELNVNHFTLGNIYAVLAEYNKSVICFENTLKIQPDFEAAAKRKHAVLCHAKLENALEHQHRSLQRTLNELRDYQRKHEFWQQQDEYISREQALPDVQFDQRVAFEHHRMRDRMVTMGDFCHMVVHDGQQSLQCSWGRRHPVNHHLNMGWSASDQDSVQDDNPPLPDPSVDYSKPVRPPLYTRKKKANSSAPKEEAEIYKAKDWPSKEECDTYVQKYPAFTEFPTTYLPPENKGFEVKALLMEAQGLKKGSQHPLPWYPPVCVSLCDIPEGHSAYDHIQSVRERAKMPARLPDTSVANVLLGLIDELDTTEAEIGQRILTALKLKTGPSWVLYNLAGLYWRINGNNYHGIECLRRALHLAPPQYKDIPLVNLANILYKWGRVDDAVNVMRDAISVNDAEPETHFFMGNMLAAKTNMTGAIYHYEEALSLDPNHEGAFTTLRTVKCYHKFTRQAQSAAPKETVTLISNPNCQKGTQVHLKQPLESRVVCKNDNGQETCVVEAQTVGSNCVSGTCKQTCTVTPIKVENCLGGEETTNCATHSVDQDINARLDEISDYYRQKGICNGDDCQRLMVQNLNQQQRPHTRLEIINGVLHRKLIFVDSPADIIVKPADCVVFNDGTKSSGCYREEFKHYDLKDFTTFLSQSCTHDDNGNHGNKACSDQLAASLLPVLPVTIQDLRLDLLDDISADLTPSEDDLKPDNIDDNNDINVEPLTFSDEDIAKFNPDPARHIHTIPDLEWPTLDECKQTQKPINFNQFLSTWVSVTNKGVDLSSLIDFETPMRGELQEPECNTEYGTKARVLDSLGSIQQLHKLNYSPELGLKPLLQKLSGSDLEPVGVIGSRIASALANDPSSWAVADLAALYWRVEGDADSAIDCIKVAYSNSPRNSKDIALLSLANILHKMQQLDDALLVTNMALEASPQLVAHHFNMANLYATKGDWVRAAQFYESTLGLQPSCGPAKERLQAIRCLKVLSDGGSSSVTQDV